MIACTYASVYVTHSLSPPPFPGPHGLLLQIQACPADANPEVVRPGVCVGVDDGPADVRCLGGPVLQPGELQCPVAHHGTIHPPYYPSPRLLRNTSLPSKPGLGVKSALVGSGVLS